MDVSAGRWTHIACGADRRRWYAADGGSAPSASGRPEWHAVEARRGTCSVFDGRYAYIIGGRTRTTKRVATAICRFDTKDGTWSAHNVAGLPPLEGAAAVYDNGAIYAVGGSYSRGACPIWLLDTSALEARQMTPCTSSASVATPQAVRSHAAACSERTIYVFGGMRDVLGPTDHLWSFNTDSERWRFVGDGKDKASGPHWPAARYSHTMAAFNGHLYVFGGRDSKMRLLSDMWSYNLSTRTWCRLSGGEQWPSARCAHTVCVLHAHMLLYGGIDTLDRQIDELWAYNFVRCGWRRVASSSAYVPPGMSHACLVSLDAATVDGRSAMKRVTHTAEYACNVQLEQESERLTSPTIYERANEEGAFGSPKHRQQMSADSGYRSTERRAKAPAQHSHTRRADSIESGKAAAIVGYECSPSTDELLHTTVSNTSLADDSSLFMSKLNPAYEHDAATELGGSTPAKTLSGAASWSDLSEGMGIAPGMVPDRLLSVAHVDATATATGTAPAPTAVEAVHTLGAGAKRSGSATAPAAGGVGRLDSPVAHNAIQMVCFDGPIARTPGRIEAADCEQHKHSLGHGDSLCLCGGHARGECVSAILIGDGSTSVTLWLACFDNHIAVDRLNRHMADLAPNFCST